MTTENHAFEQAQAQTEGIIAMVAALECDYDRLQELRDERDALKSAVEDPESDEETAEALSALADWNTDNAEELAALEEAAGECADQDEARARIQEDPLCVEVRSSWVPAADVPFTAAEFRIVLCTGGPHVEIMGELDDNGQPYRAWMQYQDWGTPMQRVFGVEQSTLLAYCAEFYFGE